MSISVGVRCLVVFIFGEFDVNDLRILCCLPLSLFIQVFISRVSCYGLECPVKVLLLFSIVAPTQDSQNTYLSVMYKPRATVRVILVTCFGN